MSEQKFDSVVMLTWSEWYTEVRSNRYHYATRFAKGCPVFFVQWDGLGTDISFEPVYAANITIVRIPGRNMDEWAAKLVILLRKRGSRRPLLWIYNHNFKKLINLLRAPCVYHASEDYFCADQFADRDSASPIIRNVRSVLQTCDLVVAVSDAVAQGIREIGEYHGDLVVLKNGCDFEFWSGTRAFTYEEPSDESCVALYQGGINYRLDYELLKSVTDGLPEWQFWFCGPAANAPYPWHELVERPNVHYLGTLTPEWIADAARRAKVGIIPFNNTNYIRNSLPLKAYEYVACGLPVVSVPITELEARPDLFRIATTPHDFIAGLIEVAPSRCDHQAVTNRLEAAKSVSYDLTFQALQDRLHSTLTRQGIRSTGMNVLILYDKSSMHIKTVQEHLNAFAQYSKHRIYFLSATERGGEKFALDFSIFDAIVIHYCVRLSLPEHIRVDIATAVSEYSGPKLLFIQDEYDNTETARVWMERLDITCVFTNVPDEYRENVYPHLRFPSMDFRPTITGYVPDDGIEKFFKPLEDRQFLVGYRGRRLPHQYGQLGYDKLRIGIEVRKWFVERGLLVDIEVDDSKRIYGDDWYRFLSSCRAMLGTESGCNLFDDYGHFAKLAAEHDDMQFPDFAARFLPEGEGPVRMNQVSPKIFEAIRLRTALILLEGEYSGVVKAHEHYIPLKPDFSNLPEVANKLSDLKYIRQLTDRAYQDVIASGAYSAKSFIRTFDHYLSNNCWVKSRETTPLSLSVFEVCPSAETHELLAMGSFCNRGAWCTYCQINSLF